MIEIFKTTILLGENGSHIFKRKINIEKLTERDAEENISIQEGFLKKLPNEEVRNITRVMEPMRIYKWGMQHEWKRRIIYTWL